MLGEEFKKTMGTGGGTCFRAVRNDAVETDEDRGDSWKFLSPERGANRRNSGMLQVTHRTMSFALVKTREERTNQDGLLKDGGR